MDRRPLSWAAAAVLAVTAVPVVPAATAAGTAASSTRATAGWGDPHLLEDSFYFGDDLGHDGGAAGSWLARVEIGGAGTTAVGHQRLRDPSGDDPVRPALSVEDTDGGWSSRVLAGPGRTGYTWVGVDGQGRTTAVWLAEDADDRGDRVVRWARRAADGTWTASHRVPGVDGRPTAFDVSPSGFGVLSSVSRRAAWVSVLEPAGTWREPVRVSGVRRGEGVARAAAVVSDRGRVTAAFWSITVDTRSETSGPLQRGGVNVDGSERDVVRLAHLDQTETFRVVGSPAGSVAVRLGDTGLAFRMAGDRWRRSTQPVVAVAVGGGAVSVAALSPTGAEPQQYSLTDYTRATGTWSTPRVVATLADTEYAGGSPSAVDLERTGATTLLGFSLWHTDTSPITYSSRVVTDVDGQASIDDLTGCFVDLDARGDRAAVLTTQACQPGGRLSVRSR